MQYKLAETVPGPSTNKVAELAKELGLYVVMGMPIKDAQKPGTIYNGLAIFTPEGLAGDYHKMHLPVPEPNWATRGDKPFILDTPWGPIGCAICYDTYCFPELMDYYVAKGCRMYINSTALAHCHGKCLGDDTLRAQCIREGIFIVSSNLGGLDKDNYFWGGSSILGPSAKTWEPHYYAGMPFIAEGADEEVNGKNITVAVMDTGIAPHLDFDQRILHFEDFCQKKLAAYDDNGHGTHVAGIIGGSGLMSKDKRGVRLLSGVAPARTSRRATAGAIAATGSTAVRLPQLSRAAWQRRIRSPRPPSRRRPRARAVAEEAASPAAAVAASAEEGAAVPSDGRPPLSGTSYSQPIG